jgi:hypothetical protein
VSRRLATIAKWINDNRPELRAVIERDHVSTDFKPKGLRYITRVGKGRSGNRIKVFVKEGGGTGWPKPIYDHSAADTYRSNDEVERWLADYIEKKP